MSPPFVIRSQQDLFGLFSRSFLLHKTIYITSNGNLFRLFSHKSVSFRAPRQVPTLGAGGNATPGGGGGGIAVPGDGASTGVSFL